MKKDTYWSTFKGVVSNKDRSNSAVAMKAKALIKRIEKQLKESRKGGSD